MNQINAREFLSAWMLLAEAAEMASKNKDRTADMAERMFLVNALCEAHYQCGRLRLEQSAQSCGFLLDWIRDPACHRTWENRMLRPGDYKMPSQAPLPHFGVVHCKLQETLAQIHKELDGIRLAAIYSDKVQFFERDNLFGTEFHQKASEEINVEVRAAGNCLAADLHTAAAFHLMRAAEAGMRALADHLQANKSLRHPVEYSEWQQVIDAMSQELETRRKQISSPRGPSKDAELDFYNGLLTSLNYFKDAYRNPVAHFRGRYDAQRAMAVLNDVKMFMLRLSAKVPLK